MTAPLELRVFAHSWRSDWNHGNAHFLRGLVQELGRLGHRVRCYEPERSWSLVNLLEEGARGQQALREFAQAFPDLDVRTYREEGFDDFAERELAGADLVVVHEWNSPAVVECILALQPRLGFRTLFHDTHHRAYTSPGEIARLRIDRFDGVLAFGEALRRIYQEAFHARRSWVFHEAADTARFHPLPAENAGDITWVGNWGDEERTRELAEFLIEPLRSVCVDKAVYGVRYPAHAQAQLAAAGIQYRGYLPNLSAPRVYSRSSLTLHIPRRCYANGLSGVPTIRMFEAMACGIPLLCSPWTDTEGLFRAGRDYLCVPDGRTMRAEIERLLRDEAARRQLASSGLETIRRRHTCAHRAEQFQQICEELGK